jgi:2-polyprenyl-3-methyl-5-hydroxy-6-metoxy-1,4-benzoquinol methylase
MPCAAQDFPSVATLENDRGVDLAVHQCDGCGLVQLLDPPVPYYRDVIRAAAFSEEMGQFRRTQLRHWVVRYGLSGKSLLEVGCGHGEYLALLQEAGVCVHGIEHSPAAIRSCRAKGLAVTRGFIDRPTQQLRAAPFDAFATFNFMEHWPKPVATLQGIRNNLREGGLGLVEVPNFDMILRQGLYSEFIGDHLSYFTRTTLEYSLQTAGFDVLECNSVWHDYILSAVVRKRTESDWTLLAARRDAVTRALQAMLNRYPEKAVAVWGAGHQALAVIAIAGIGGRIKYVVDSAPFKQNRFTPATHVPIVPPDTLDTDPVNAVIVMAASYSDEVARIIRSKHGQELEVAILRDFGLESC